jgi:hypothetical protein
LIIWILKLQVRHIISRFWSTGKFLDTVNVVKDIIFETWIEETLNWM